MDYPEKLWKQYIQTEIDLKKFDKAENIFEELIRNTDHAKVWYSYAKFLKVQNNKEKMRNVFEKGIFYFSEKKLNKQIMFLIDKWIEAEDEPTQKDKIRNTYLKNFQVDHIDNLNDATLDSIIHKSQNLIDDHLNFGGLEFLENALQWKKEEDQLNTNTNNNNNK